jgi:hypothetical protein
MKKTTALLLAILLLLGFYIAFERTKIFVYKLQVKNPLSIQIVSQIIKERSQIFYGYIPTVYSDVGNSLIYVEMLNSIDPLLKNGEFLVVQNGRKVLDNSDVLGANFLGPIKINNSVEMEILIFLKNESFKKLNLEQPIYIFLDRPKNTAILFDVNTLGRLFIQDQILSMQKATTLTNASIPIFFYSNESQLDLIANQLKSFKGYTLLYSSPLPQEFVNKVNELNITLQQEENLQPEFMGTNLIAWDAIGLKRVINYPSIELQSFLNKSIIGIFETYPKQQIKEATNKTKLFVTLLSTLPLNDVKLLATLQKSIDYSGFLIFYITFIFVAFLLIKQDKQKKNILERLLIDGAFALSLTLIYGFNQIVYLALLFSILLPKNKISISLLASCLIISAFSSSIFSTFFIVSFSYVFLSFLEKKI